MQNLKRKFKEAHRKKNAQYKPKKKGYSPYRLAHKNAFNNGWHNYQDKFRKLRWRVAGNTPFAELSEETKHSLMEVFIEEWEHDSKDKVKRMKKKLFFESKSESDRKKEINRKHRLKSQAK